MGLHQQITTCRKSGGPLSGHCPCEHCTLSVCSVCLAYEGGLTSDCPGATISADRQREIYETSLDYTDERGWHQAVLRRRPRFAGRESPAPCRAPVDWAAVERTTNLERALVRKGIAWALADRRCDDYSAALTLLQSAVDAWSCEEQGVALLQRLELARTTFLQASHRAEKCDAEFRQAARMLFDELASSTRLRPEAIDALGLPEHVG